MINTERGNGSAGNEPASSKETTAILKTAVMICRQLPTREHCILSVTLSAGSAWIDLDEQYFASAEFD